MRKISFSTSTAATAVVVLIGLFGQLANSQLIGCRNNPCQNGGRCVDQAGSFYGYSCICVGPWKGVNCDQYLSSGGSIGTGIGIGGYQQGHNQWQSQYPYNQQGGVNQYGQYPGQYPYNQGSGSYYQNQNQNQYPYNNNPSLSGQYGQYGYGGSYGGAGTACQSNPCFNGAYCQPNGQYSYTCLCRTGFYGQRCESYTNQSTITIGIIIGSIALFYVIVVAIAVIAYCCCCSRRN